MHKVGHESDPLIFRHSHFVGLKMSCCGSKYYNFEDADEETREKRAQIYTNPATVMVNMTKVLPPKVYMPIRFKHMADSIKDFEIRNDDILMVSFPKAGSTVTQEMVWQIANGFDLERGKEIVFTRARYVEMSQFQSEGAAFIPTAADDGVQKKTDDPMALIQLFMSDSVGFASKMKSPRVLKTHLPLTMFADDTSKKSKVLWIARNPKDTLISLFKHETILPIHGLKPEAFDEFFKNFLKGETVYGGYWDYMREMWQYRDDPNVKLIWFEDLRRDLKGTIIDIAKFLGKDDFVHDEEKIAKLVDHLDIKNFRNNDAVNMKPPKGSVPEEVRNNFNFIGQGNIGGWKAQLDDAKKAELDAWIKKNNEDLKIPIKFE